MSKLASNMMVKTRFNIGNFLKEVGLYLDREGSRNSYDVAHLQRLSRAPQMHALYGNRPDVKNAWIAPNALLLGRVLISPWATVWYNAVLRAEVHTVRVGHFSSIGDGTVIFSSTSTPINVAPSVNIGKNVSVGENCTIYSSIIDDDVKIGARTYIGEGCIIERGAEIQPNSIIPPGSLIPAGQLWGGNTIKYVRDLTDDEQWENYSQSYKLGVGQSDQKENSLWPSSYIETQPKGDETVDDYVEKNYFRKGLFK